VGILTRYYIQTKLQHFNLFCGPSVSHGLGLSLFHRRSFFKQYNSFCVKEPQQWIIAFLCGPCHHGMAHPRVADGGYGLQILRAAANVLNKQSGTAEYDWIWSLGGDWELFTSKDQHVTKCYTWLRAGNGLLERYRQRKTDMNYGTWNVRSVYRAGSLTTVASELAKCNLDLVSVKRWDGTKLVVSQQMIIHLSMEMGMLLIT
jgi:hypothetical protein